MSYGIKLAIACLFHNSTLFLREWLDYHLCVGVEKFYLGNHNSSDDFRSVLQPYIDRQLVELEDIASNYHGVLEFEVGVHLNFFNRVIARTRGHVKWLALIDCDEFIMPVAAPLLLPMLEQYDAYAGVAINWQCYGSSGLYDLPPGKGLLESLVRKSETYHPENTHVKVVVRPERASHCTNPHVCAPHAPHFVVNTNHDRVNGPFSAPIRIDELRINHYTVGTGRYWDTVKTPYLIKWGGPFSNRHLESFRNVEEDRAMDSFVARIKARASLLGLVSGRRCLELYDRDGPLLAADAQFRAHCAALHSVDATREPADTVPDVLRLRGVALGSVDVLVLHTCRAALCQTLIRVCAPYLAPGAKIVTHACGKTHNDSTLGPFVFSTTDATATPGVTVTSPRDNWADWERYLRDYPDLPAAGISTPSGAREHWLHHGAHEGRRLHSLAGHSLNDAYDWHAYLNTYADLRQNGIHTGPHALQHWVLFGQREHRVLPLRAGIQPAKDSRRQAAYKQCTLVVQSPQG